MSLLPDMTTTNRTCLMNFAKTHGGWCNILTPTKTAAILSEYSYGSQKKTEISPTLLVSDTFVLIAICAYFKNKTFLYIDWPLVRWTLDDPLRWKRQCETIFLSCKKKLHAKPSALPSEKKIFPPLSTFRFGGEFEILLSRYSHK